ncbi:MAG: glycerate kinase [Bacteroidales bacterium]|nr:glycerate kinase [Bacteroidales bacterium]
MKFLLAPDSYKNSLTALEVAEAMKKGIQAELFEAEIQMLPMADGGEGTVNALVDSTGGKYIQAEVFDPLMRKRKATYGLLGDNKTAVIEMAAASGIEILNEEERNPWITTTYGTGQLMMEAVNKGCEKIIIGIGGSATIDGGVGMARALGIKFYNNLNQEVGTGGGELSSIEKIDISKLDPRIVQAEIIVACDVNNLLTGTEGASFTYGPQKGANREMVEKLDNNLKHLAGKIRQQLNIDIENIEGSGAAGGLGGGLMAFTKAILKPGFDIIRHETHLDEFIKKTDIVFTGEGKIDDQTQYGKTPMGVAGVAKKYNKPVIAIAGTLGEGYQLLYNLGFDSIVSVIDKPMQLNEALITASELVERTTRSLVRTLLIQR